MASTKVQQIAQQNDQFRSRDPNVPGIRVITVGINELLKQLDIPMGELAQLVADYSDFNPDNDPHSEHDFGGFEFHDHKVFWKIDDSDLDYKMGSDDPTDLTKTRRVLSIMLAEEW